MSHEAGFTAAFPHDEKSSDGGHWHSHPGMSLRDYFAGQALIVVGQEYLHRNGFHGDTLHGNLACHAYRIADAMIAERAKANQS